MHIIQKLYLLFGYENALIKPMFADWYISGKFEDTNWKADIKFPSSILTKL